LAPLHPRYGYIHHQIRFETFDAQLDGEKKADLAISHLRKPRALETPRVAAPQQDLAYDEWNQNSDEWNGEFVIYPLAFKND